MTDNNKQTEDDVIDVESFARDGKQIPKGKKYRIRVDKEKFVVSSPTITGREILALVNKTPQTYRLYEHFHAASSKIVPPDEVVDLTAPGVERFTTMKIENTEGALA